MNRERVELCGEIALIVGTILVPVCGVIVGQLGILRQPVISAVLAVEGMCCEQRAKPVVRLLTQTNGVAKVAPDYKQSLIHLELAQADVSARTIWDALAATEVRPVELLMKGISFRSRPLE